MGNIDLGSIGGGVGGFIGFLILGCILVACCKQCCAGSESNDTSFNLGPAFESVGMFESRADVK
jgi:hypothetical protein